jgi:hypothetical protein
LDTREDAAETAARVPPYVWLEVALPFDKLGSNGFGK